MAAISARVQSMVRTCEGLTVVGAVAEDWSSVQGLESDEHAVPFGDLPSAGQAPPDW